jgi:hypothetical protein
MRILVGLVSMAAFLGCAPSGTRPHEMSAAQHAATAEQEEHAATLHSAQYNPAASEKQRTCDIVQGTALVTCWTSVENPTSEHKEEAVRLRKLAAEHRAGSQALRDAEVQACAGLAPDDRDISPFEHREDIAQVETVKLSTTPRSGPHVVGARILFRPVPGLTREKLQHLVDCHLARASAAGHQMPEMPNCPLVPKDATARVIATKEGLVVEVVSDNRDSAEEIDRRAHALVR